MTESNSYRQLCLFAALVCVVSFFALHLRMAAQDARYRRHQSWSTEDGLPQDSVHRIVQTNDGFIWAATENGIVRFDGIYFKTFNHTNEPAFLSDDVCCLLSGTGSELWVGTSDGLLQLQEGHFRRFDQKNGLPSSAILSLTSTSDGSVLILTSNGLVRWRHNRLEPVENMPSGMRWIGPSTHGEALVLHGGKPFLLSNGTLEPAPTKSENSNGPIEGVAEGPDSSLWAFSNTAVTVTGNGSFKEWKIGHGLPGNRVESLFVDRSGTAWVGTNDGLSSLSKDSDTATPVASLRGNAVLQTFEDREGNLWIGSETSGLHILRLTKFRTEAGLADKVLTSVVQSSDGVIWIGTRKDGLYRIRDDATDQPVRADMLTSPVVLSLAPGQKGSVWVGTPDGLNHVNANGAVKRITSADGLPDDYIQAILADPDNSLWIGTRHGLVHLRGSTIDIFTKASGLGGDLIGTIFRARDGELWVGTSGGLSRRSLDGKFAIVAPANGLPEGIVTSMAEDEAGALSIVTKNGRISLFSAGQFRLISLLSSGFGISNIFADDGGALWLRAEHGMVRITSTNLNRCADSGEDCSQYLIPYGVADGIPSEEMVSVGSPVFWKMQNGEVWSPTRRGVAIFDPRHLPFNHVPPLVAIERFLVDESPVSIGGTIIDVPFGRSRFTVEYAGLSYTAPSEVRYRFMLEGFDAAWNEAGNRRSATYTNLPPKSYRFRVQAMNNDGIWSEAGATLRFRVVPPYYRRWWFIALIILSLTGLSAVLYRLRLRRLQAQFDAVLKERNRIAREIHDTLAQDFVGVSIQLDIVAQLLEINQIDPALLQVKQTRKLVEDGLADARQSIWELRANLAKDSLPTRLAKVVERYSESSITMRLKIGGAFRQLDAKLEEEVLRIAQESLSNVQRHARATTVDIQLRYERTMLVLAIIDNGQGFTVNDALQAEGHYGLRGMRERAGVVGGALEITSSPGDGSKITLTISIAGLEERNDG